MIKNSIQVINKRKLKRLHVSPKKNNTISKYSNYIVQ